MNFYSVPVEWVGREVGVSLEAERVILRVPREERVEHRRLYGRNEMSLELDHYLPLLARKHRGLDRAVPMRRFLEREDACWRALLRDLRRREGEVAGSKAFVDVLLLCRQHGVEAVTCAVREAVGHSEVSLGLVRFHLVKVTEELRPRPGVIDYPGPQVRQSSTADYSSLLSSPEVCRG